MISNPSFLNEQIDNILIYLAVFKSDGSTFSHKTEPTQDPDGYWVMTYDMLSDEAVSFVKSLYDNGWILGSFDWASYSRTKEYETLVFKGGLTDASPEQVARILTTIVRRDRFAPGWLASAYNDGLLTRILTRLQVIRNCSCAHVA